MRVVNHRCHIDFISFGIPSLDSLPPSPTRIPPAPAEAAPEAPPKVSPKHLVMRVMAAAAPQCGHHHIHHHEGLRPVQSTWGFSRGEDKLGGCLKRSARAMQLFGRLAVLETHTL